VGQKVNPIGFRTGITEDWKSRWFAPKASYGEFLVEDQRIRRFVDKRLNRQPPYAAVASIQIERTRDAVKIILQTARPGLVIGPKGAEVDKLKDAIEELIDRKVSVNIIEIKEPALNAQLVAEGVAEQLKKRAAFRRTMKQYMEQAMNAGAKGVKVQCRGRLGGREMASSETQHRGSLPVQTLQAHVDYGFALCRTTYGAIGVKVWIYLGRYGEETAQQGRETEGGRRPAHRGKL
jgi:small subunit ribosomal protein S3